MNEYGRTLGKWNVVRFVDDGFDEMVSGHRKFSSARKAAARLRSQLERGSDVKYYVVKESELPWS